MKYYPVLLNLEGRRCLVVGGGGVGTRKVMGLLACGADVMVVSPEVSAKIAALAAAGTIDHRARGYQPHDLEGMFLVVGATDDQALNHQIYSDAEARSMLCNIADRPKVCNFILPAVLRRGDLVVAFSTSGKSPAFARRLRLEMQERFGPEYADLLDLMGCIRAKLLAEDHAPEAHKPLFEALLDGGLLALLRDDRRDDIDTLLHDVLGEGFSLGQLAVSEVDRDGHCSR
jgi:precorrin-2 dehydrogenase/sirohydrochlorin ferrochelatase